MTAGKRSPAVPPRGPRRLRGRLIAGGALVLALAAGGFWLARRQDGSSAPGPPPLVPLDAIAWPQAPPPARGLLEEGRRALALSEERYGEGDAARGEALLASGLESLARAGALPPGLAGHSLKAVEAAAARGDLAEAERRAARWLERHPEDFDHLFLQGQVRHGAGRWALARESLRKAALARPDSVAAFHWLAEACFRMGAQEEGVKAVRSALALIGFPAGGYWKRPDARDIVGNAVKVLHRFQEYDLLAEVAREYRTRFGGLTPEAVAEVAMAEGIALAHTGRHAEAEPLLRTALGRGATAANADEVAFALGLSLLKQGKAEEARAALAGLLAASPHFPRAYYQLGMALSRLGRSEQAEAMFEASRELAPSEREVKRSLELSGVGEPGRAAAARSLAHSLRGQPAEAEDVLRARDLGEDPHAVFALAELYIDSLRAADAEKVLLHASRLVGEGHADVVGNRARCLFLRGDADRAIEALRSLPGGPGARPDWRLRLARILLVSGRRAEAVRELEGLRGSGVDREASFLLGQALLEEGEPRRALEALRSVSTGDTRWDDWEGNAWLARALLAAGGDAAALQEAGRLLEAAPARSRSTAVQLRARIAFRERSGAGPEEIQAARAALERHVALEPSAAGLRRQIASEEWPRSAPLYLALARLEASRGNLGEAVRLARLSNQAAATPEALRAIAGWLPGDSRVFFRLRALRDLLKLAPGDAPAAEEVRRIESAWLAAASPGKAP
jgi:tetratricopeptide (TPR) repeat protein